MELFLPRSTSEMTHVRSYNKTAAFSLNYCRKRHDIPMRDGSNKIIQATTKSGEYCFANWLNVMRRTREGWKSWVKKKVSGGAWLHLLIALLIIFLLHSENELIIFWISRNLNLVRTFLRPFRSVIKSANECPNNENYFPIELLAIRSLIEFGTMKTEFAPSGVSKEEPVLRCNTAWGRMNFTVCVFVTTKVELDSCN